MLESKFFVSFAFVLPISTLTNFFCYWILYLLTIELQYLLISHSWQSL